MSRNRRSRGLGAASLVAIALALGGGVAQAGEPRLDRLAAERGIEAGALELGATVDVPGARNTKAERRGLTLHGIPVRGAFETSWRAGDGPARVVASRYPGADADLRPEHARIDRDAARETFMTRLRPGQRDRAAHLDGELVYLLLADQPVLAWEFTAPLDLGAPDRRPSRERVWVSAASGQILDAVEQIDFENQAEVYAVN